MRLAWACVACGVVLCLADVAESAPGACAWTELQPGLDVAECSGNADSLDLSDPIIILRMDPELWDLRLLCADRDSDGQNRTAREWCEQENLVAAINAGMYGTDYQTHVGYIKAGQHVQNANINAYRSILAFGAKVENLPRAQVFDLDVTPVDRIQELYDNMVQNLRLIMRPATNRWSRQEERWSEAALGEDADGNILFIFSTAPFSMYEFNEILLALPIGLVCAQHLEGGPEAQLYYSLPGHERELVGSFETGFWEHRMNTRATRIPNAIGIDRRH